MQRFRHLTVALANRESDAGLLAYAEAVAGLGTAPDVHLVHVLPASAGTSTPSRADVTAALRAEAARHAPQLAARATTAVHVLAGPLTDSLLAHAAEQHTDLLLLGHGARHSGRKALARRLAMKAPCSVWMVPENSRPTFTRILVPVDLSPAAADALVVATSLAALAGQSECVALHVYLNEAVTYEGYDRVLQGQEQQAYAAFVAPLNTHGVRVKPLFDEGGDVATVIDHVATAEDADLVVMATRGRSASSAILLGSVAEDVIIQSARPVLAVKHFGARLGVLQALLDRRFRQQGELRTS